MKRALSLAYLALSLAAQLSEDDDSAARRLYAGEARETAKTLMLHKNSKSARRFRRLTEALSKRKAGGRDL